ncbi:MAG: DUF3316 domain-containing protein [Muribaculaceae bacterium]|nr:DUF3316 domain-containing protein [Muribaculaceae bacterium]
MNRLVRILLCLACLWASLLANADNSISADSVQTLRPVTSSYSVEYGAASTLDTYLSPLRYQGSTITLNGSWLKAMRQNPRRLIMAFDASIGLESQLSPARNSRLYDFSLDFSWSMMYRWRPIEHFQVGVGGGAALNIGALYLARNSNNPVSARASVDITANAMASYSLHIGRLPVRLIDRVSIPMVGAFFSPEYGETYYEIYLGNHAGLAHCGWWGNHFRIDNLLAADISLGTVALRVGYHFDFSSGKVHDIVTRHTTHSLVIGLTHDSLNITGLDKSQNIIPAIY